MAVDELKTFNIPLKSEKKKQDGEDVVKPLSMGILYSMLGEMTSIVFIVSPEVKKSVINFILTNKRISRLQFRGHWFNTTNYQFVFLYGR